MEMRMGVPSTGSEIIACLSGTRAWWKLRASDVQPWVKTLHAAATQDHTSRTEWIGDAWDGTSDIAVGDRVVLGADAAELLNELRLGIRQQDLQGVALPDATSLRQCFVGVAARQSLTVDIDFGDFLLPLSIGGGSLDRAGKASIRDVAAKMVQVIIAAASMRTRISARERRIRDALEGTVANSGGGVVPLWLRMEPLPYFKVPGLLTSQRYDLVVVMLDGSLAWSPIGTDSVRSVAEIRRLAGYLAGDQRRRAAILNDLQTAGLAGRISEVAAAFLEEKGLDPLVVLDQAIKARRAHRLGCVEFERAGKCETIHYDEGVLHASIAFEGGAYFSGRLTIWGEYPEAVANGAKGRALSDYVNHPTFVATDIKVSQAGIHGQSLHLSHEVRLMPIAFSARSDEARDVGLAA